jgi:hypothetical protein
MTPTTRFRYIERTVPINESTGKRVHILQQWWEDHNNILHSTRTNETEWVKHYAGEWCDIPLEQEA